MRRARKNEEAQGIEAAFKRRWDREERYFEKSSVLFSLFHAFRKQGYDRSLSVKAVKIISDRPLIWGFILSRSLNPIEDNNQLSLRLLQTREVPIYVQFTGSNVNVELNLERAEITKEMEPLLTALLVYPIDYISFLDGDDYHD